MASFLIPGLLALSSARLVASQDQQTTWGSVVMVLNGERVPDYINAPSSLTPLGAQQALSAGSVIRTRYLQGPATNVTESFPIYDISQIAIENDQLYLLAENLDYVAASAQAFMQGVYPPIGVAFVDAKALLSNDTLIQYPLGGYQYPLIDTVSSNDFNYIWVAGNANCPEYVYSKNDYFDSLDYNVTMAASLQFYQSLVPAVFANAIPKSMASYENAYNLWDYARYQDTHNSTVVHYLTPGDLMQLRDLASQQEFAMNGNLSVSGLTEGDGILTIAGQTWAGHALSLLGQNVGSGGNLSKLSVLFGRYQAFLAFFALSGLSNINDDFKSIPEPGSVMVFELFSNTPNATNFPDTKDLWVRFLFRNGTDPSSSLLSYPIFGSPNSQVDMTWNDFLTNMGTIAIADASTWCTTCNSDSLFCHTFEDNIKNGTGDTGGISGTDSSGGSDRKLSPTIAGVIGAAVTIAAFVLLISAAVLCFGLRFYRNGSKRQSLLGGFKGAEKLASDTDLTVAKGGVGASVVRQERTGSWELGDTKKDIENGGSSTRVVSTADYSTKHDDDGDSIVNPFGDPVKSDDRV